MRYPGKEWHVYGLCDPRTGELKYIGYTEMPVKRLRQHLDMALSGREQNHAKREWIMDLLAAGSSPEMKVLHVCKDRFFAIALERSLQEVHSKEILNPQSGPVGGSQDPAVLMAVVSLLSQELACAAKAIRRSALSMNGEERTSGIWDSDYRRERLDTIRESAGMLPMTPVKRKRIRDARHLARA